VATPRGSRTLPRRIPVGQMTTTEARKHLPELVNMAAYGHVTTMFTRDGRRLPRIVPEEDAWVYSPAWQESSAKPTPTLPRAASGGAAVVYNPRSARQEAVTTCSVSVWRACSRPGLVTS
jgi:antitoxin (DNA-binding transcriptional repressor) of toxin-antitoxin stability system